MADVAAPAPAAPNAPTKAPANVAPAAPAPNGAKPDAAAAVESEFELKVDGQTKKFKRADAERLLSKASYADKVIQQAKEAMKALKAREEELEKERSVKDPGELLKARGMDPEQYARAVLERKLAEAQMSPEQREIASRDAQLKELQDKLKAADDERNQMRLTENAKRIQIHMENELGAAWERAGFQRGDSDTFFAVYETVKEFRDLGLLNPKDFTAADADRICEAAKEKIDGAFGNLEKSVTKGLKGKALYDRLGKSVVDELNRYQMELVRGGGLKASKPAAAAPKEDAPKYMSPSEALEFMKRNRSR